MNHLLFVFVLFCFALQSQGQSSEIDSLKSVLPQLSGANYVRTASDLAWYTLEFNTNEALKYARSAQAQATTLNDELLIADVENDLSLIFLKQNEFDSAIHYANSAYAKRMRLGLLSKAAASLSKVANAYIGLGKYDQALNTYFETLRLFETAKDSVRYTQIAGNIGTTYEKNLNFEEAKRWHIKTIEWAQKIGDTDTYLNAKINLGICNNKQNNPQEAIRILSEALEEAEPLEKYNQIGSIFQSLGVAHRALNNHQQGLDYYKKALEIFKLIDDKPAEALILVNIGNTYTDLNNFEAADSCLKQGFSAAQKLHSLEIMRDANNGLYSFAKKQGDFEKALHYLEQYVAYDDSMYTDDANRAIAELNVKYQAEKKQNELLQAQNDLNKSRADIERRNVYIIAAISLLIILVVSIWIIMLRNKINRERQLAAHYKLMEQERLRISRDLHDNLGADLTWISAELDLKAYQLSSEALKSDFRSISHKTHEAMKSLRETIWTIHNENIALSEVGIKLKEQTAGICKEKGILFSVNTIGNDYTPDPMRLLHIYRLCKEAVTNAIKHAQCTEINMSSEVLSNSLVKITIEDNGIGYQAEDKPNSYGLQNMKERIKEIRGSFEVTTEKGKGTKVTFTLPQITTQN